MSICAARRVGRTVVIASIVDVEGQVLGEAATGEPIEINWGQTIGAGVGAFVGGLGSDTLLEASPELADTWIGATWMASLTSIPGAVLPAVGANFWPHGESEHEPCSDPHP